MMKREGIRLFRVPVLDVVANGNEEEEKCEQRAKSMLYSVFC